MIPNELEIGTVNAPSAGYKVLRERCMANDVRFLDESHPYNMRPWIIGNEYGAQCLVWASHEQDAFDIAYDADMLPGLSVDQDTYAQECADACARARCEQAAHNCDTPDGYMLVGNASEPIDSTYAWIAEASLTPLQERYFAEARGAGADTLDDI